MELITRPLKHLEDQGYEFALLLKFPKDDLEISPKFTETVFSSGIGPQLQLTLREVCSRSLRAASSCSISSENSQDEVLEIPRKVLFLDDRPSVERYFHNVFRSLKQLPCKAIAKAWIKVIEPKKKTRFPYIKGNRFKPYWWPEDVEHREPDHLKKPERIRLMTSIIADYIPSLHDPKVLDDIKRSTDSTSLFNNDEQKRTVLEEAYKVCWGLCSKSTSIEVLDFDSFTYPRRLQKNVRAVHNPLDYLKHSHIQQHYLNKNLVAYSDVTTILSQSFPSTSSGEDYSFGFGDNMHSPPQFDVPVKLLHFNDMLIPPRGM